MDLLLGHFGRPFVGIFVGPFGGPYLVDHSSGPVEDHLVGHSSGKSQLRSFVVAQPQFLPHKLK